ncbi:hypothetical protein Naga_101703g1 [Nannochloropsis gaditana]|uniref:Uncharacterized protein n=1 Tax=Nannochloropsis gaditana TaxID=72520 RepID=W7TIM7_9STRA|nr:hypothetical protein Naga_101703g1 [Nannochloropsis gaditana]
MARFTCPPHSGSGVDVSFILVCRSLSGRRRQCVQCLSIHQPSDINLLILASTIHEGVTCTREASFHFGVHSRVSAQPHLLRFLIAIFLLEKDTINPFFPCRHEPDTVPSNFLLTISMGDETPLYHLVQSSLWTAAVEADTEYFPPTYQQVRECFD